MFWVICPLLLREFLASAIFPAWKSEFIVMCWEKNLVMPIKGVFGLTNYRVSVFRNAITGKMHFPELCIVAFVYFFACKFYYQTKM